MWSLRHFPRVFIGFAFMLLTAAAQETQPAAGKTPSATGKWLVEQEPQWQAAFQSEVKGVYDKGLADLKKQYLATLETMLNAAARDGKLDDAVAVRAERDRVAGVAIPADDDPSVLPALRSLRAGFAKSFAAITADRAAHAKAVHAKYDAILGQSQIALTQRQRLDEALEVKAKREQLTADWLAGLPAAAVTPPVSTSVSLPAATPSVTTPRPLPIASTVRPAERMDLFLAGSNGLTLYINNKEVIKGVIREKASKVRVGLREGDVLIVRNADRWDINSTWISCISSAGQFLFETTTKWTAFVPTSEAKWWNLKAVKEEKPAEYAPDKQEYVDRVKNAMKETPLNHGAQPIRSPFHIEGSTATYLHYTVTRDDLLPKPNPEGAAK